MEEIGCCDKGLTVVVFSTCITVASSIDEECVVFVIGEEEVSEQAPLQLLLLKLRITSSSSTSSPFSSLSSVSFIEVDNGEFDGEEEEEDNPLLERSRGCWDELLEVRILAFFLSPSMCLLLRSVNDEGRWFKWLWRGCGESRALEA